MYNKILLAGLIFISSLFAQSPEELIRKAEDLVKGMNAVSTFSMTITTEYFERTLVMDSWWEGNDNALIVIKSPRKEKGNKTLKIGNEMWGYLRNTETTIKIPPSMMLQAWNGSDFTNDDLVRESNLANDYFQTLAGEEEKNGQLCWRVELKPKPDAPVVWGKLVYFVRKADYLPAAVEYFDEKGELIRYMIYSDIKKFDDREIPSKMTMYNNIKKGNSTSLEYQKLKFVKKIDGRKFTFKELERGN